eukprot:scaffold20375_cov23-Cyclotella_meneghiniana.AAC.1
MAPMRLHSWRWGTSIREQSRPGRGSMTSLVRRLSAVMACSRCRGMGGMMGCIKVAAGDTESDSRRRSSL